MIIEITSCKLILIIINHINHFKKNYSYWKIIIIKKKTKEKLYIIKKIYNFSTKDGGVTKSGK